MRTATHQENRPFQFSLRTLLIVFAGLAALIPLLLWAVDRSYFIAWVGRTNLGMQVLVLDKNQNPIPDATVEVVSEGRIHDDHGEQFVLTTDANGLARYEYPDSMCHGTQSAMGFIDSFYVYLPGWQVRVSAAGYGTVEWFMVYESEYREKVERTRPGESKLVIRVDLPDGE